ncbi:MAG: methyltransferase domain-containing protein [Yoonia sp.]|uniref:class I SAM-dependent methyltransferase n=1 Tax=Yoonia sp. TaxID=2212373 RepID=UPI0032655C5B
MTDPLTELRHLEADLMTRASGIASQFAQPASDVRNTAVEMQWQGIARQFGPYQSCLAALQNAPVTFDPDHQTYLKHGAYRASLWSKTRVLLDRIAAHTTQPLVTQPKLQAVDRSSDLISYLTNSLHYLANPIAEDRQFSHETQFPDIPLSGDYFVNLMQAAYRVSLAQSGKRPLRFLDVGCGGGTKLMIAAHFFEQVDGLEYNSAFAANARQALRSSQTEGCHVIEGDALEFDGYGDYDVIYFYRPISDPQMLVGMQNRILRQAKEGAIIIAPTAAPIAKSQAVVVAENIYLAHATAEYATTIAAKAEQMGPDWLLENPPFDQALGFWLPLIKACHDNGFCLPR